MMQVLLPYECMSQHIRSAMPWRHGFYPWCTKKCPNYPDGVVRVRMDPAGKMQVRMSDGWHWIKGANK